MSVVKNPALCILVVASLACAVAACGDGETGGAPASLGTRQTRPATTTPASTTAPALLRNAADANELVGESPHDLKARLASLKGHPVVVNQWASWCGPCRHEFPFFAAAVKQHGAKVAFVGIDYMDSRDAAEGLLDEQPPGFASVYDGDGKAARAIDSSPVMPTTLFIGPDGRTRYRKLGGYADAAALDADIRRHALEAP